MLSSEGLACVEKWVEFPRVPWGWMSIRSSLREVIVKGPMCS